MQKDDGLKFLDARRFRPNIIGMYTGCIFETMRFKNIPPYIEL